MLRLSKLADYGIVLMTHFAREPQQAVHTAAELAKEAELPMPTVSKVLKSLSRAGLLVSHRGVKGGYSLARQADAVTVDEIITAVEGPIGLTECTGHAPSVCELEPGCPVRGNWHKLTSVVREALSRLTLDEMARPIPAPRPELTRPPTARALPVVRSKAS